MSGITGFCINGNKIVPQEKRIFHMLVSWHTKQIMKHRNILLHHILLKAGKKDLFYEGHAQSITR
jgi:hypothetical protein